MVKEESSRSELEARLLEWLDTSGRTLELRVARRLREAGAIVRPSISYVDSVTEKIRETDVVADFEWLEKLDETTGDLPCSIETVVECKSSIKHPWLAFFEGARRAMPDDLNEWVAFGHALYTPVHERLPREWIGEEPFTIATPATHTVSAFGSTSGGESERNPANDAVRQVLAATLALKTSYLDELRQAQSKRGLFLMPVIVTAAPLFMCTLNNRDEVELQPTERFDVWGYMTDGKRARVYVMAESHVPEFARGLRYQALRAGG